MQQRVDRATSALFHDSTPHLTTLVRVGTNPPIRDLYRHLAAREKRRKLALIAAMKLLWIPELWVGVKRGLP
jgi:hypothetical protein